MEKKVYKEKTNWNAIGNFISDALDYFERDTLLSCMIERELECVFDKVNDIISYEQGKDSKDLERCKTHY